MWVHVITANAFGRHLSFSLSAINTKKLSKEVAGKRLRSYAVMHERKKANQRNQPNKQANVSNKK